MTFGPAIYSINTTRSEIVAATNYMTTPSLLESIDLRKRWAILDTHSTDVG